MKLSVTNEGETKEGDSANALAIWAMMSALITAS